MRSVLYTFSLMMLVSTFAQVSEAGYIIAGDSFSSNRIIVEDRFENFTRFRMCSSDLKSCSSLKSSSFVAHPKSKNLFSDEEIRSAYQDGKLATFGVVSANAVAVPISIVTGFAIGVLSEGALVFLPTAYLSAATSASTVLWSSTAGIVSMSAGPRNLIKQLNVIRAYDFSKLFIPAMSQSNLIVSFPDDSIEEIGSRIFERLNPN